MKKLLTIILAMALILPAISLAELPDISGLTDDELLELDRQIQLRLFGDRISGGVEINPGQYIVGEDIPSGSYRAEVILSNNSSIDLYMIGYVAVYQSKELQSEVFGCMTGPGSEKVGKFTLEDGQMFEVNGFSIRLYRFGGFF